MRHRSSLYIIALSFVIVLLVGCSTKKNNFFSRSYHNLSAHYNAWWNGNESIKEGIKDLETSSKDNFTDILPVYKLGTKAEAASVNSKADRAIEKAGTVIQRHSMYIKKKEYCKWIDDSYLMIGKAHYYKQDYYAAARTFDFTAARYRGTGQAKEALVWSIRTNSQLKKFSKAQNTIEEFKEQVRRGAISKKLTKDYYLAVADFYYQQGKYSDELPFLEKALWMTGSKTEKCRIAFIMGQIYYKLGDLGKATEYFNIAAQKSYNYEFLINSKLNIAKSYDPSKGNSSKINKYLSRMLKEDKNEEYKDQIYYALAEIARLDGKYPKMTEYLKKSVATSKANDFQKFQSSLQLADYLFLQNDYISSKNYYDTANQFLPKEHHDYKEISRRTKLLTNLGDKFIIIKDEDSLQRVAAMPEEQRNKLIDGIIEKIKKEEEEKKLQEERDRRLAEMGGLPEANRPTTPGSPTLGRSSWYFYNSSLVTSGINDFNRKWGNRKLEDLWRLKNKQIIDFGSENADELLADGSAKSDSLQNAANDNSPTSRQTYLANLPFSAEQLLSSNQRIAEAYYDAANIFLDDLKDFISAERTFDSLSLRFTDTTINKHLLYSYYQIYKLNNDKLGNMPKADIYKQKILDEFPETDYAKIIVDPEYYIMIEQKKNIVKNLYKSTYDAYNKKNYFSVFGNVMIAEQDYPNDILIPKFKYLEALSLLKTAPMDSTITVLQSIISKYPKSDIKPNAEMLLNSIAKYDPEQFGHYQTDSDNTGDSINSNPNKIRYKREAKELFNYIMLVNSLEVDIDALKIRISDHNYTYRKLSNLTITALLAYDNYFMLIVNPFENEKAAMDYYEVISQDDYIFSSRFRETNPTTFIISKKNFQEMFKNKDFENYYEFFKKEYLK